MKFVTPSFVLALVFFGGFWAFLFYAFSGAVTLTNPVIAGLAGAALSQSTQIMLIIAGHYYSRGRRDSDSALKSDN